MTSKAETKTTDHAADHDEWQHDEQGEREALGSQPAGGNVTGTVLKGAAVGAAAGAAIGAWAAFAKTTWPKQMEQTTRAVTDAVREVGSSAARAAAQTLDPAAVAELLPGDGDRTQVVKRTARDAATAAARAARETISTLSENANGSEPRNDEEGD